MKQASKPNRVDQLYEAGVKPLIISTRDAKTFPSDLQRERIVRFLPEHMTFELRYEHR